MKPKVAKRLEVLSESETLAMARRSRELKAKGFDIVSLSLGEPDYDTPEFIKEAAHQAIRDNYSHYTPVSGIPELKEAISVKFKRDNQLDYKPEQIVVSTGAKQSLANVILSLVNVDDEVILPAPYWVSYKEMVKLAGGIPVVPYAGIEHDFKITPELLDSFITPKTRMIIFSSPCNPTGSVYSENELKKLAAFLRKHEEIIVVSDEIYEHINYSGKHYSIACYEGLYEQTVTVNGLSKSFAMTGWRLGYIGAPKWIADACDKFQGQITSATCAVTQKAAVTALLADPAEIQYMVNGFHSRRSLMASLLNEIPGLKVNMPEGAFYFFPNISHFLGKTGKGEIINSPTELSMYLLNHFHVATVGGEAFGCNQSIRLSYAVSDEQIRKAVSRIREGLLSLN
ncbi:MAG: pyridoxal phosphate-dependent aminotransferase [Flavobacteriales bacterium]